MNRLKEKRGLSGLSQSQLATISGVSTRMIQKYEIGEKDINKAQIGTIYRLAAALGCNMEDIIDFEDEVLKMNLVGMKWKHLSDEQKDVLFTHADCVDGIDGNKSKGGECIVDFSGFQTLMSVNGFLLSGEDEDCIWIDGEEVIYNSAE